MTMKFFLLPFCLLIASCTCRDVFCVDSMQLIIEFPGYTPNEIQQSVFYKYKQGTSFAQAEDSLQGINFINTYNQAVLVAAYFDYRIRISGRDVYISNLRFDVSSTRVCGFGKRIDPATCPLVDDYTLSGFQTSQRGDTISITK
jgi:hypothetical protein